MLEIRGDLDLGQEPFGSQLGFQDLQRDLAFVLDIVGQVDGSHPADVPPPAVPLAMLDLQPFVVPGAEAS